MRYLFILSLIFMTGCTTSLNPLYAPAERISMTALPEYKYYVSHDDRFSPEEKEIRIKNAEDFIMRTWAYRDKRQSIVDKIKGLIGGVLGLFGG